VLGSVVEMFPVEIGSVVVGSSLPSQAVNSTTTVANAKNTATILRNNIASHNLSSVLYYKKLSKSNEEILIYRRLKFSLIYFAQFSLI
jgi:hypothetical protein